MKVLQILRKIKYKHLKIFFIAIASFLLLNIHKNMGVDIRGDSFDYIAMLEAFRNHCSPDIQPQDMQEILMDIEQFHPDGEIKETARYANELKKYLEKDHVFGDGAIGTYIGKNGKAYNYHFWMYSLVNLPVRFCLDALGHNPFKSFAFTNALLVLLVMTYILFFTKGLNELSRWFAVLAFAFSSVLWYQTWIHTEVYTACLVLASLFMFFDKRYYLAIFICAMAITQNPPLLPLIVFYGIYALLKKGFKLSVIGKLCLAGVWGGLPFFFYYWHFGKFSLIVGDYFNVKYVTFTRFWGVFFDLDQGMIYGLPLILPLFLIVCLVELYKAIAYKKLHYHFFLVPTIILVTLMYCPMSNWNHGMSVISRYAVWTSMVVLGYFVYLTKSYKYKLLIFLPALALQIYSVFVFGGISPPGWGGKQKFLSNWAMNHLPNWYNPDPHIFQIRITRDYVPRSFAYFMDASGEIRKIMVHKHYVDDLWKIGFKKEDIPKIKKRLRFIYDFAYINPEVLERFKREDSPCFEINCDCESLGLNGATYIGNPAKFEFKYGKVTQSSEKAYSGKYSDKIYSSKPFGLTLDVPGVGPGDIIQLSAWKNSFSNVGNFVIDGPRVYEKGSVTTEIEGFWKKITLSAHLPNDYSSNSIRVYFMNTDTTPVYIDDMKIKIIKAGTLPENIGNK